MLALVGARRVLQTLAKSPHLALSLLLLPKIAFRLSTHISNFLLMIEAPARQQIAAGRAHFRVVIVPQFTHLEQKRTPFGASTPGRTRTCDTWFRKPLLYPLSYRGQTQPV